MAKIDEGACSLFYQYTITDKNGKIVRKTRKRRAHSFVKGFLKCMYIAFGNFSAQVVSVVNTVGTTTTTSSSSYMIVTASVSEDDRGIVVGSGSAAVSIDDYKLQTRITDGSSAGMLQYGSCAVSEPSATTSVAQFVVSREFSNETGNSVSINEVGIYGRMSLYSGSFVMFVRDTVSIVLADAEHLTFNYIIQTTL